MNSQRSTKRERGVFEKEPGSGVWWIRFIDAEGALRREKVGSKSAAIKLYRSRKTDAMEGKKLPRKLRAPTITLRTQRRTMKGGRPTRTASRR
jgi:hypothetical protein